MNIRCRGPSGQSTLSGLDGGLSLSDFQEMLAEKTGVPASHQELLGGFPPAPISLPAGGSCTLGDLPIANGDTIVVRRREISTVAAASVATTADEQPAQQSAEQRAQAQEDEELARAIAASLGDDASSVPAPQVASSAPAQPAASSAWPRAALRGEVEAADVASNAASESTSQPAHIAPPASVAVPGGGGSAVVRRTIASDNSCLFNAVGYVMEHSRQHAARLRQIIAETVAGDPEEYSEAFLGKPNQEYCRWIKDSQKWGGAIELSILARYFGREIAAYDVQTKRCDLYGQDAGYSERVMLIYNGLHYDALAVAAFEGAPEDVDITMFEAKGAEADAIGRAAAELVAKSHKARQFTDTANFTLRCLVCQLGVKGEKEALLHAKATGHQNFGEY
ncbi:probable ubiquitin thioesterase OTU1 at C-terminar half [Coccomyxa sp. Obi]|nr:probable ubiquitin thioesterase OTU1 at C-terminar half [Coccomyxa sp. Obi]